VITLFVDRNECNNSELRLLYHYFMEHQSFFPHADWQGCICQMQPCQPTLDLLFDTGVSSGSWRCMMVTPRWRSQIALALWVVNF